MSLQSYKGLTEKEIKKVLKCCIQNSFRILHKLSSHCTKNSACVLRASKYDEYFYECIRSFTISETIKIHFLWIICILI